jgi:hypothetical protein
MSLTLSFECRAGSLPLSLDDDEGLPLGDAIRGGGEAGGGPGEAGKLTTSRGDVVP